VRLGGCIRQQFRTRNESGPERGTGQQFTARHTMFAHDRLLCLHGEIELPGWPGFCA
jgi:hypothetical protein